MRLGEAAGLWGLGQNDRKHATCMPSGFESRLSLPSRRATRPADATIGHWGRVCTVKLAILLVQYRQSKFHSFMGPDAMGTWRFCI